jgi:hypothetical protein
MKVADGVQIPDGGGQDTRRQKIGLLAAEILTDKGDKDQRQEEARPHARYTCSTAEESRSRTGGQEQRKHEAGRRSQPSGKNAR